jgi:plastocyanin
MIERSVTIMENRSKVIFVTAGVLVVLAIVLSSCGGGGGGYGGGGTPIAASTVQVVICSAGTTTTVSIVSQNFPGFDPASVTVPVNSIVQWTNNDLTMPYHTVTSTTVPANGTFDSGNLAPGASICLKFTSAGTFGYHCSLHPTTMIGAVTVQ